jgi:hypothetical protein
VVSNVHRNACCMLQYMSKQMSCKCRQVRDVSLSATWRSQPRSHWQVMAAILENGRRVSPLLQAPWVTTAIVRIDWLHCADQGIAADFLGNLLLMLTGKCPGPTHKERTAVLWRKVQKFYEDFAVEDRLQNLVPTMLKQPKKAPKLRCSAAQCRALVPFGELAAQEMLADDVLVEAAAKAAMLHLSQCYKALSRQSIFASDVLREHSSKFALQFCALESVTADAKSWRIKPKLHLFLELCSEGSKPALFWNYRDEDWGGSVSRMSRRRGGLLSVKAFSGNLITKFRLQPMVRMVENRRSRGI